MKPTTKQEYNSLIAYEGTKPDKHKGQFKKKIKRLVSKARRRVHKNNFNVGGFMRDEIKKLEEEKEILTSRLAKINTAIQALQNICAHPQFEYYGRDSHHSYEKCTICGYDRKIQ